MFSIARNFLLSASFVLYFFVLSEILSLFFDTIVVVITCNTFSHPSKTIDNTFYPFLGY